MILGATGDDIIATLNEHRSHRLRVLQYLQLVCLEFRLQRFLEAHGLGGNHVLQRAALGTGEHGGIQFLFDLFIGARQDQTTTGTTQGLVSGSGHYVGKRHRVGVNACGYQTGYVSHVHEQIGTDLVGNGAEAGEIQHLGVSREASHDHLRLVLQGQPLDLVVIDHAVIVDAVLHRVIQLAGGRHLGTVGQVATVGQAHAQDGVTGVQQGQVDGRVGLGTGMGLHIGVVGAEQLLGAVDGQLFHYVDMLAATVIALARIAFGVFVGQYRALGFHHRRAGVVFRRDQLNVFFLTLLFSLHGFPQFGVEFGDVDVG